MAGCENGQTYFISLFLDMLSCCPVMMDLMLTTTMLN